MELLFDLTSTETKELLSLMKKFVKSYNKFSSR